MGAYIHKYIHIHTYSLTHTHTHTHLVRAEEDAVGSHGAGGHVGVPHGARGGAARLRLADDSVRPELPGLGRALFRVWGLGLGFRI